MATSKSRLFDFILPKKKAKSGGTSVTNTYRAGNTAVLSLPEYMEHTEDIQSTRLSEDSLELIQDLMKTDPDVSAATNSYLTIADTNLKCLVYNRDGSLDREGLKVLQNVQYQLFTLTDYTLGFQMKPTLHQLCEDFRYMLLMRGSIAAELVYDKALRPSEVRVVDTGTLKFKEEKPGDYKPVQETDNERDIDLNIPTFFYSRFRQDPTNVYSYSFFTAAINTIAARQQVINDLYRIMRVTGFPRITIEVLEEVVRKFAPKEARDDSAKMAQYMQDTMSKLVNSFSNIRSDKPFAHTDSVKVSILNDKNPGAGLQVGEIIETLNAQNQAALKVVAPVLGRGSSGVNTASVESRLFSMSADSFNEPIADLLSRMFTLAVRTAGFDGFVICKFDKAEMRPELELEAQKTMKQARLLEQLSLGLITDEEFHIEMNGKMGEDGAQVLSGTNFRSNKIDTTSVSPNSDPLGRSLTPEDSDMAKSSGVKQAGK